MTMRTCPIPSSVQPKLQMRYGGHHAGKSPSPRNSFRVPGLMRDFHVKIATDRNERAQAYELLAANYRARGYESDGEQPYRFTPYHALPGTVTLVALHHDRVVATLSLVSDSEALGLPLEAIYGPEVAQLRAAGLQVAEAISLADTGLSIREFVAVFKALITLAMQYHASRGGDCWVITVNPRHSNFYQKVLGFTPLGSRRSYPSVQDHPAEAYFLTTSAMAAKAPEIHQAVFGAELPDAVLTAPPWSEQDVRYFGTRSSQLDGQTLERLLDSIADREDSSF